MVSLAVDPSVIASGDCVARVKSKPALVASYAGSVLVGSADDATAG
ncbi:MAG: hypothetical protein FWF91_04870 [Coriobacteriia bacterium]|nr:hypothetical protein [Coriobacteriia bacterium]